MNVLSIPRIRAYVLLSGLILPSASAAGAPEARGQTWKTVTAARMITDEKLLRVRISYGAAVLKLGRSDAGLLYRAVLRVDEEAEPVIEYDHEHVHLGVSNRERRGIGWGDSGNRTSGNSMDLELSREVPLEVDLDFGAGRADLDLTGLPLRRLELNTGVAETVLYINELNPETMESAVFAAGAADFHIRGMGNLNAKTVTVKAGISSVTLGLDGEWPRESRLFVDMGLGALQLIIPESLGVQVRKHGSFLASFDTDGLVEREGTYQSANWAVADRSLDIEISAAMGSIDLTWIR